MKPLNIFVALGLAVFIPLTALADRNGPRDTGPRHSGPRCGNDRSFNSYNSGWGGSYGGWGHIPANPYGGQYSPPRPWNSGGWGYGGNGFGSVPRGGAFKADYLIERGIQNGQLSRYEIRDIREDQRDIRRKEQRYYSDGFLSNRERNDLRGEYRDLYKDVRHNLKDGERRFRR